MAFMERAAPLIRLRVVLQSKFQPFCLRLIAEFYCQWVDYLCNNNYYNITKIIDIQISTTVCVRDYMFFSIIIYRLLLQAE